MVRGFIRTASSLALRITGRRPECLAIRRHARVAPGLSPACAARARRQRVGGPGSRAATACRTAVESGARTLRTHPRRSRRSFDGSSRSAGRRPRIASGSGGRRESAYAVHSRVVRSGPIEAGRQAIAQGAGPTATRSRPDAFPRDDRTGLMTDRPTRTRCGGTRGRSSAAVRSGSSPARPCWAWRSCWSRSRWEDGRLYQSLQSGKAIVMPNRTVVCGATGASCR